MLNYNSPIMETKNYSEIKISEVEHIIKINLRGKSREFITKIGKELSIIPPTDPNTSSGNEMTIGFVTVFSGKRYSAGGQHDDKINPARKVQLIKGGRAITLARSRFLFAVVPPDLNVGVLCREKPHRAFQR